MTLTTLMWLACSDQPGESEPAAGGVDFGSNAPAVPTGRWRAEFDGYGLHEDSAAGTPVSITADVGESCGSAWGAGSVLQNPSSWSGGAAPVVPADPAAGMVWSLSEEPVLVLAIRSSAPEDAGVGYSEGSNPSVAEYYWSGGEMEVVTWTADQIHVLLRGGEICDDPAGGAGCSPSEGWIQVERRESPFRLAPAEDLGWRGVHAHLDDPRTGEPLCDVVTYSPEAPEGTTLP